jgi:phage tail sheath protein FI
MTITGVSTSIAAFIGWAAKGSTTEAVLVQSFFDYENQFGGLDERSYLGYAVNQFFENGGQQAYIVRLVWSDAAAASVNAGKLSIYAANPGIWANGLQVVVTPTSAGAFNLEILDANSIVLEAYLGLTAASAVATIDSESEYIKLQSIGVPSAAETVTLAGGHDGTVLRPKDGVHGNGDFEIALKAGLGLLDGVAFNLLCVPGESDEGTVAELRSYCHAHRAFYIVDGPRTATAASLMAGPIATGDYLEYAALYVPWVLTPNPLPPSGAVAGIIAATDSNQGVWRAPAGVEASIAGVTGLQYVLTDSENDSLNARGINCLRTFNDYGNVVWGARTMQGSDQGGSQWKYIPVKRLALYIESSLDQGTQWVVFEPNAEPLWSQIRLDVAEFLQGLFAQRAFQGTEPQQGYFVKCDAETNPQSSIDQGIVNIVVGFAPLYPSEFVVIQIQQMNASS